MASSDRMKPVRRVAENRERKAAKSFGDAQQRMQEQEGKLQQLRVFELEYQKRFEDTSRCGMSSSQLQEYQSFIAKLQITIKQQEMMVEQSRRESGSKKLHWQQKYTRTQAIGKVMDRFSREEHLARERKEQKESDEFGLRKSGPGEI